MGPIFQLTSLLLLISCARSQIISQDPRSVVERRGGTASLHCSIKGVSSPNLYWYRQSPRAGIELLSYSVIARSVQENVLSHFTAERPEDLTFTLKTTSLMLNDTAVYFCAWSHVGGYEEAYFGQGTKLTVLEDGLDVTAPNVALFDPSPQEINDKGLATLVCLVSRFYPDHLNLSWSVNGVERTAGVRTDDSPTRDSDKMYSMSSRLRLSKMEWLNPQNTFKCTVHFDPTNETISKETQGQEGCGITPDSLLKSGNAGKLIYLLLITKSGFYGLFVTMLGLKVKQSTRKNLI